MLRQKEAGHIEHVLFGSYANLLTRFSVAHALLRAAFTLV